MPSFKVSAPGKVVLFGEYAVLDGACALVASVDRFVHCNVTPAADFEVHAQGFGRFSIENLKEAPPILRSIFEQHSPPHAHFELDSSELYLHKNPQGIKLGLGSSAAVTTALLKAVLRIAGSSLTPESVFASAHRAHYGAQGLGSGVDIAAAAFGGMFQYQLRHHAHPVTTRENRHVATAGPRIAVVDMLTTDTQPTLLAVHLGIAASTPKFVRAVRHVQTEHPDLYAARIQELSDLSALAIEAWRSGNLKGLRQCCLHNNQILRVLGKHAGVDIVPAQLDTLNAQLVRHNAIAKTTGAGGGDLAWIPCEDDEHASSIEKHLKDHWSVHRFSSASSVS